MVAQDVAHDELSVEARRGRDNPLGVFHGGRQRLFHEDMCARLHRRDGEVGVAVGIGGDDDKLGSRLHPRFETVEPGVVGKRGWQIAWRAVDQPDDLGTRVGVMGQRVAHPHVPEPHDKRFGHFRRLPFAAGWRANR
jgi:hypothetical protein